MDNNRRKFLKTGAAAIGAASLGIPAFTGEASAHTSLRDRRLKLSLAAYSLRSHFRNEGYTMKEFIDYCDELNLDGTELTSYFFESNDDEYLRGLRLHAFRQGLDISGTAIGNNLVTPDRGERNKEIKAVKMWIDKALVLGAPSIRVFGGGQIPDGYTENDAYDWVIPAMSECVDYAASKGIVLAIENHGGFPVTSEQTVRIINEVDSPWLGVNLDTGNFLSDWYRQMAELIPHAVVVQLKASLNSTVEDQKIATNPERIVSMLKYGGFKGYLVLEYEAENPFENIPIWIDTLKELVA
jgi:sugar phosphate isomerase/epimerase